MRDPAPFRRPVNWDRLRMDEAERVVRERAADTSNIILSDHAFDRLRERGEGGLVTAVNVYDILATGAVDAGPVREAGGSWKVIVAKRMAGTREAGVVTLIARDDGLLFVKTVEWLDWIG